MNNEIRKIIFVSQVENVRFLNKAIKQARRTINDGLRCGDEVQVSVHTKVFALIFCAWAEANFLKTIHTPYGFESNEITQIKNMWKKKGLAEAWKVALSVGLRRVPAQRSNFIPNAKQSIVRYIMAYVEEPANLRNKIAHGQWMIALNRDNTSVNGGLTSKISELDVVTVERWYEGHKLLAGVVESLIESPEKTFARDYWGQLSDLDEFSRKSSKWTLEGKRDALRKKIPTKKSIQRK